MMKKINWMFLTLFAFVFAACGDDDEVLDTTAPTISIATPTEGAEYLPGEEVPVSFVVTDDMGLETVSLAVNGTNVQSWGVSDFLNDDTNFSRDYDLLLAENTAPGTYTITIDATDNAGNTATTTTRTFTVLEPSNEVAFTVTGVPENTPADDVLYIAGEFAEGTWVEPGTDETFAMTKNDDGTWSITLNPIEEDDILEYKIFRQGGWGTGEQTAACEGVPNRTLTLSESTEVTDIEVAAWEDLCVQ